MIGHRVGRGVVANLSSRAVTRASTSRCFAFWTNSESFSLLLFYLLLSLKSLNLQMESEGRFLQCRRIMGSKIVKSFPKRRRKKARIQFYAKNYPIDVRFIVQRVVKHVWLTLSFSPFGDRKTCNVSRGSINRDAWNRGCLRSSNNNRIILLSGNGTNGRALRFARSGRS